LQASPTTADHTIARHLLPRLIAFVINTDPEDPENARALVSHSLVQYVLMLPAAHVPVAMALVVPTLLARAAAEGGERLYRETSARLLELAGKDQTAFRGVVGAMNEGQRAFMEEVIRSGRQPGSDGRDLGEETDKPTIALKMDFGG
jgi:hypothetical protein